MSSFSRTQFPPGGWQFHQPQTGWSTPNPLSTTFDTTVQQIITMRRKNGALTVRHKLSLDPVQVGNELELYTRLRVGMPLPAPPPPGALPGLGASMLNTVSEIKRIAFGAGLLMDWAESRMGGVMQNQAEDRASLCAQCPKNNRAKLESWVKEPLAVSLKTRLAGIDSMKLRTALDGQLGLCDVLFSPVGYLVHEPQSLIDRKLKAAVRDELWERCWIKNQQT